MWRNALALRQVTQRSISTVSRRQAENRVSESQKLFQEDNGLPVHLKGGAKDSLLYRTTAGLTAFGLMYGVREKQNYYIYSAKESNVITAHTRTAFHTSLTPPSDRNNVCFLLSASLFNAQEAKLIPFEDASATNISLSTSHVTVVAAYYKQLA